MGLIADLSISITLRDKIGGIGKKKDIIGNGAQLSSGTGRKKQGQKRMFRGCDWGSWENKRCKGERR